MARLVVAGMAVVAALLPTGNAAADEVGDLLREADRLLALRYDPWAANTVARQQLIAQTEQALVKVRQAEELAADSARVKHRLGVCLSLLGWYDAAEAAFSVAEERAGTDDLPMVLQDRGLCALRQGQDDRAKGFFERVLAIRPWQPDTRYYLGLIYERRGNRERAMQLYVEEMNVNGPYAAKAWRAYFRLKGGDPDKGRSLSTTLIIIAIWLGVLGMAGAVIWRRRQRS